MTQEIPLKNILNKNIEDHKAEIKFIAQSSLNGFKSQNKLENGVKWKTSIVKTKTKLKSEKSIPFHKSQAQEKDDFTNRLFLFSLGPDEVVDKPETNKQIKPPILLKSLNKVSRVKEMKLDNKKPISPTYKETVCNMAVSAETFNFSSPRFPVRDNLRNDEINNEEIKELLPHYIHPSFKTRYVELLRFREENIREKDEMEKEVLAGTNLVKHLEKRLKKKLLNIEKLRHTPNFHRLQIYTEIFDDLISESWMFGSIFSMIKSAYDSEVERVLEMPVSQKELLESEMDQLRQSIFNKEKLENLQSEIVQVEEAIKIAIKTDEEFDNLLIDEEAKLQEILQRKNKMDEEKRHQIQSCSVSTVHTESEKLELLKSNCWEIMDNISFIQKETKQKMCSRSTVTHLTEAVQDIGIEVEKLNYHRSQLESEVGQMREQLRNLLESVDIREEDYKLIDSVMDGSANFPLQDHVESNKWNWYIS